jgi:hypothetical protein
MEHRVLLGFTKHNEVVFAEVDNSRGYFSVGFETSYPMAIGYDETKERIEDLIEQMDAQWVLNKLDYYDCSPSQLPEKLYDDTYDHVSEFFDNSLYTESFRLERIEQDIYFLASACGQHDTRGSMVWYANAELYDIIHEAWDDSHLKTIDEEGFNKIVEAIKHQNSTMDEYKVIEQWLGKHYGK